MASFSQRMIGAATLSVGTYEEVEADRSATGQAMTVVVISSIAAGIGTMSAGISGLIFGTCAALIGWFVWAFLTYIIGTKIIPEPQTRSDMGELLRTIGFASSPGILRILAIVPLVGAFIGFLISIWMLVAMVIAVRQALDYQSTGRAIGVCLIGWVINMLIFAAVWMIAGVSLT